MRVAAARARQRGFFDFSFPEVVITFGVALMVLGPKKLPGLVAQVGRWVGRARHMARQFREQLEQEVNSINAVKPVPRHVAPEVGPAVPPTEAAAAASAYGNAAPEPAPGAATATATAPAPAADPAATPADGPAGAAPTPEAHPEAQVYFAMNGSTPEVVTHNPYTTHEDLAAPPPAVAATAEPAKPVPGDHG